MRVVILLLLLAVPAIWAGKSPSDPATPTVPIDVSTDPEACSKALAAVKTDYANLDQALFLRAVNSPTKCQAVLQQLDLSYDLTLPVPTNSKYSASSREVLRVKLMGLGTVLPYKAFALIPDTLLDIYSLRLL